MIARGMMVDPVWHRRRTMRDRDGLNVFQRLARKQERRDAISSARLDARLALNNLRWLYVNGRQPPAIVRWQPVTRPAARLAQLRMKAVSIHQAASAAANYKDPS